MYLGAVKPPVTALSQQQMEDKEDYKKSAVMGALILAAAWAFAPNRNHLAKYAVGFASIATACYVIKGDGIKILGKTII